MNPHHLGVPLGAPKKISFNVVHLTQTMHLSYAEINTLQMDPNELPLDPRHEWVPSGVSKMIYETMVRSTQIEHLSCAEINTISKQTQMSFPLTHIAEEIDRVRPILFQSLLHVWRKPCTYLVSRLTLSPNWSKRASTWPMSTRTTVGCPLKRFPSLWYIWRKPCTYLVPRWTLSPNRLKIASTWPT